MMYVGVGGMAPHSGRFESSRDAIGSVASVNSCLCGAPPTLPEAFLPAPEAGHG